MVRFVEGAERKHLSGQLMWFIAWLGITVAALALAPSPTLHGTHQQLGLPACPSVAFFDRPCFGCGMTTSFTALLHLDVVTAWKANPFGPIFYLIFTASAIACIYGYLNRFYFDTSSKAFNRATMVLTVAFVAFGIARFASTKYGSDEYRLTQTALGMGGGEKGR
ncbi:MAG: DUF2752 domain-containing protein [Fimbriimonadaceae bacterium]